MKITRINHAAVNIHGKVDEAREFYTELLGLPEVPIQLPGRPPIPKGAIQAFWSGRRVGIEAVDQQRAIPRRRHGRPSRAASGERNLTDFVAMTAHE